MGISHLLYDIRHTPAVYLIKKIGTRLGRLFSAGSEKISIVSHDGRLDQPYYVITGSMTLAAALGKCTVDEDVRQYLIGMYLDHRFDILGSGWVRTDYGHPVLGIDGYQYQTDVTISQSRSAWLSEILAPAHLRVSQTLFEAIRKDDYVPIDWQRDHKSGARWDSRKWYGQQINLNRHRIGADIKMPWELGRLQHLFRMACFASSDETNRDVLIREFHDQCLDFFASNPVGMGVQWASTMDVGLRITNLLLAYDIFRDLDTKGVLNHGFHQIFCNQVTLHARFIVTHLESKEGLANNHYLANLLGILCCIVYLEEAPETNQWLKLAVTELFIEVQKQFLQDGGNFEGSTAYHLLSGEMIFWATGFLMMISQERLARAGIPHFPDTQFRSTLRRIYAFTESLEAPDGTFPQFGDNDSGRIFALTPTGSWMTPEQVKALYPNLTGIESLHPNDEIYWDENMLDMRSAVSVQRAFFYRDPSPASLEPFRFERGVVHCLCPDPIAVPPLERGLAKVVPSVARQMDHVSEITFRSTQDLTSGLQSTLFPEFGLYVFRSGHLYLAISGINQHQLQYWSHGHNDKLGFDLWIEGKPVTLDPGTYVYTAIPQKRNTFRSVYAHCVPVHDTQEQNVWPPGLFGVFRMTGRTKCQLVDLTTTMITLSLKYGTITHHRTWEIMPDGVKVTDKSSSAFVTSWNSQCVHSAGYGKIRSHPTASHMCK